MKVKVLRVFYDENGLHRPEDIIDTEAFDANLMEAIEEPKKETTKKVVKK